MSFLQKLLTPPLTSSSKTKISKIKKNISPVPTSVLMEKDAFRSYVSSELSDTVGELILEWKEEAFSLDTNLRIDENRRVQDSYLHDTLISLLERSIEPILEQPKGGGTAHHENERSADDGENEEDD